MLNIKSRHVDDEITKLMKQYLNEHEKVVKLMHQTVLQKKINSSRYKNNY